MGKASHTRQLLLTECQVCVGSSVASVNGGGVGGFILFLFSGIT